MGTRSAAFAAAIFDLDGVITDTATVHARAWQQLFNDFLLHHAGRNGQAPFDPVHDYLDHVDGKPRSDGVRDFLKSRGIQLPEGEASAGPEQNTIAGLGARKDGYFVETLRRQGVGVFPASQKLVEQLRDHGIKTAIVSSSRNCQRVLEMANIAALFDTRVDGLTLEEMQLPGKPAPDMFLEGARRLGVDPGAAMVVEDAVSGVEAGRAGQFGLVVGVARRNNGDELLQHGADLVVRDLAELDLQHIQHCFEEPRDAAQRA